MRSTIVPPLAAALVSAIASFACFLQPAAASQADMEGLLTLMETNMRELVVETEQLQSRRCDLAVVSESSCGGQNYHDCGSKLPAPECNEGDHPTSPPKKHTQDCMVVNACHELTSAPHTHGQARRCLSAGQRADRESCLPE